MHQARIVFTEWFMQIHTPTTNVLLSDEPSIKMERLGVCEHAQ